MEEYVDPSEEAAIKTALIEKINSLLESHKVDLEKAADNLREVNSAVFNTAVKSEQANPDSVIPKSSSRISVTELDIKTFKSILEGSHEITEFAQYLDTLLLDIETIRTMHASELSSEQVQKLEEAKLTLIQVKQIYLA